MDRPVVEPNTTVVIAPAEGMLEPIFVVSRRKIFPGMGAATPDAHAICATIATDPNTVGVREKLNGSWSAHGIRRPDPG